MLNILISNGYMVDGKVVVEQVSYWPTGGFEIGCIRGDQTELFFGGCRINTTSTHFEVTTF